jgi:signal peptidase II
LGNLVDRLHDGAVTDFVRWRIHDHRWPIFNIADAALFVGVALLLLEGILARRRAPAG